jgi:hypothetical protein
MRLVFALIVIVLVLYGHDAAGEIVQDPNATTAADWQRQKLDYNRRTLAGAYERAGVRDPRWDRQAMFVLDLMATRFTNAGNDSWPSVQWTPTSQQILAAVHHAFNAGCTDPLVLYCQAVVLSDEGWVDDARPRLREAFEGIVSRDYPPNRKAAAAGRILKNFNAKDEPELYAQAEQVRRDAHLAIARGEGWMPQDRRIVFQLIWTDEYDREPIGVQRTMFAAINAQPGVDPWLLDMISGSYYIREAWAARGSGWANTVTREGWEGFRRNLRLASQRLRAAWKRHPDHPEAPTAMITVAMAGHADAGEDERLWFDRAVTAQFDYHPAYTNLASALLPRWGGSHQAMYELGVECLETKRFDTRVPFVLIENVRMVAKDRDGDWSFLQDPGIFENVRLAIEQYVESPLTDETRFELSTELAMLAWKAGRYKDARVLLDTLGQHASATAITRFDTRLDEVYGEIYLLSSSQADEANKLLHAAHHKAEALEAAWQRLADRLPEDDYGRRYARAQALRFGDTHRLAAGQTVEINSILALECVNGHWLEEEEGRFVASGLPNGRAIALYRPVIGQHYEFTGRYEILSQPGVEDRAAGIILAHADGVPWYELYPNLDLGQAILQSSQGHRRRVPGAVPQTGSFVIRVTGELVAGVWINGHEVTSDWPMVQGVEVRDRRIGLSIPTGRGHRVAFDQLRVRRLDVAPPSTQPLTP